ncbi:DUF1264 domain-containing protein [Candidatus Pacearchaeota archaeon]|nr:DUF1264 domain-containing protein [Candidatus Pacearchaeota archaeon]
MKGNLTNRKKIVLSAVVTVIATFLILGPTIVKSVNGNGEEDPTQGFNIHVSVGRHDSSHLEAQMDHFCKLTPPIVATCLLFAEENMATPPGQPNSPQLAQIEYIISREQYLQLPLRERQSWHDHAVELTAERGAPECISLPDGLDCGTLVNILHSTYGKVVTLWDPVDSLPNYPPYVFLVDSPFALKQDLNHDLEDVWEVGDGSASSADDLPNCGIKQAGPCTNGDRR